MATISVWCSEDFELPAGSGLGFYGDAGFGAPVSLNGFQGRTFMTTPNGDAEGFEANNCKLCSAGAWSGVGGVSGVIVGQTGDGIFLRNLPNYLATLNLRFEHSQSIRTQNAVLYVHDGSNKAHDPSGLIAYCAELIHPTPQQTDLGDGDGYWSPVHGTTAALGLADSPGMSGAFAGVPLHVDRRHDWFVAMSCSPTSPNDKAFGFSFELEFI